MSRGLQIGNLTSYQQILNASKRRCMENQQRELQRKQEEIRILSSSQPLPQNISRLNLENVNRLLTEEFYQYNAMEGISVVSKALLTGKDAYETSLKVHQQIPQLKLLSQGAFGYAFSADVGDRQNLFKIIVKTSKDPNADDLTHEIIVGFLGTNKLRQEIPNYAFIYGGFNCSPPVVNEGSKNVTNFCTNNNRNSVTYALYENIQGDTMQKNLSTIRGIDFVQIYLQVLFALNLGNMECDFTHYDLHAGNVILRNPFGDQFFGINYRTRSAQFYLYTNTIATFIDYGMSHIKYKGKDFGTNNLATFCQDGFKSYPMFDAFKFLLFSMLDAQNAGNVDVLNSCATILRFFTGEDANKMISLHSGNILTYYMLPPDSPLRNMSLEPLIGYILNNIDCSGFISDVELTEFPLLSCSDMCLTLQQVEREIIQK